MVVTFSAAKSLRRGSNTFLMAASNLLRPISARKSFIYQITASGALAGTSDILCQKFVEKRDKIDLKRAAGFASVVCFCVAPLTYKWYQIIERTIPAVGPKWKLALKRTALDQTIGAPFFASVILFNLNMIETRSFETSINNVKKLLLPVLATNYKFWPFIQLVNLTVIPIQFRVVMVQFCSIFWNMYLSYMQHKDGHKVQ